MLMMMMLLLLGCGPVCFVVGVDMLVVVVVVLLVGVLLSLHLRSCSLTMLGLMLMWTGWCSTALLVAPGWPFVSVFLLVSFVALSPRYAVPVVPDNASPVGMAPS